MVDTPTNCHSGPDRCALSFNGGKDCTVLLDLLTQEYDGPKPSSGYWSTCYVAHENPFPELEQFVADCTQRYWYIHLYL